jgi:hypothetical protein
MKLIEQKRSAHRRINLNAVAVPLKAIEEWSLRVGGMIYDEGCDDALKEVLPGIYLVRGSGIGRIYSHRIGFIPPEFEGELEIDEG